MDADASTDAERLRALAAIGLGPRSDADMEYFAQQVHDLLDVPIALVSLMQADRQVFPGQHGLTQPWATLRETPLSHSSCQHVVTSGEPLVIDDARTDPVLRDNPAIEDLGIVGYAGMPLTDANGTVLGALCAIDTKPHTWTQTELTALHATARACSTELRLRLARHDTHLERTRARELQDRVAQSLLHSQLLLSASQALSDVSSVNELRDQIADLVAGNLKPARVALILTQDLGRQTRLEDQRDTEPTENRHIPDGQWDDFDATGATPVARTVRERQLVHIPDLHTTNDSSHYLDDGLGAYRIRGTSTDPRSLNKHDQQSTYDLQHHLEQARTTGGLRNRSLRHSSEGDWVTRTASVALWRPGAHD